VLDEMEEKNLVGRAGEIGDLFGRRLRQLQERHPSVIGEVRTERGAMMAIELVRDGDAGQPDAELAKKLVATAASRGLIVLSCGIRGNVIRFMPALTISDELAEEGLDILGGCFAELTGRG
jgi:4-aminobutyrate aminotransferase/(S)-3-amino-2-methylpropionate transaminase